MTPPTAEEVAARKDEGFALVAAERRALADRLDALTAEQWATPTLCSAWTVRDMVAHLTVGPTVSIPEFALAMARARGRFHVANQRLTARRASASPAELTATLRRIAEHRFTPPGADWRAPLAEMLIHREDIARPLGGWERDPEPWRDALGFLVTRHARGSFVDVDVRGVRLVATDLGWVEGEGPEVRGAAADLALLLAGREPVGESVDGEGVEPLLGPRR